MATTMTDAIRARAGRPTRNTEEPPAEDATAAELVEQIRAALGQLDGQLEQLAALVDDAATADPKR